MNKLSLIEDIIEKCEEVQNEVEFLKTLAGKAKDPKWVVVDIDLDNLKAMGKAQADIIIVKAQELRALLPP